MVTFPNNLSEEHEALLADIMAAHGYDELRPTQWQAFESGILEGGNHLLVAETGNGKTLCAEALTKQTLEAGGRVAYLVPSRNLVNDKADELQEWAREEHSIVKGSYGRGDVIVATFDSFFSAMLRGAGSVTSLDRVVLDDFHIIYDRRRGAGLEKAIAATAENNIPIFAMSATVGNPEELAGWLNANPIISDEDRGIEIVERPIEVDDSRERKTQVADVVASHSDNAPFLVFNSSRRKAEARAKEFAERGIFADDQSRSTRSALRSQVETTLTEKLRELAEVMEKGVAFHHAGLPNSVRNWIEECFRDGDIQAIFCTPTLAYGFDSPVQSVVVSDLKRYDVEAGYQTYVGTWEYVQWIGRSARPGMGYDQGYAYVLYSDFDEASDRFFGERELERVTTHMNSQQELRWLLLELIEMGWETRDEIEEFMQETLLWHQLEPADQWGSASGGGSGHSSTNDFRVEPRGQTHTGTPDQLDQLRDMLAREANWLQKYEFIRDPPVTEAFETTELGSAAVEFNHDTWSSFSLRGVFNLCRQLESYDRLTAIDLLQEFGVLEDVYTTNTPTESFERKLRGAELDPNADPDVLAGALGWYWCQNLPLDEIEDETGIEGTSVSMTSRSLSQTLDAATALFDAIAVDKPDWYGDLVSSVDHGVPRGQVPIAENVDGVGRAKIRNVGEYLSTAASSDAMAMDFTAETVTGGLVEMYLTLDVPESQFKNILRTPSGIGTTLSERLLSFIEAFGEEQQYTETTSSGDLQLISQPDGKWYNVSPLFGSAAVESDAGTAPNVVSRPTNLDEWN